MTDAPDLPHGHALSWGIAEAPQRGPRREMSVERIVDAAIELADREGLGAVSMHRVAAALGYTPMSLYRYVSSKDDLLLLMLDAASDVPIVLTGADWRTRVTEWARFIHATFVAHPWLSELAPIQTPTTPNRLRALDAGLSALADLPVSEQGRASVAFLILGYIALHGRSGRGDALDPAVVAALPHLVTEDRFPHLAALVHHENLLDESSDAGFGFGLARVLDGVESWAARFPDSPDDDRSLPPGVLNDKSVKSAAKDVDEAERRLRDARAAARKVVDAALQRELAVAAKARERDEQRAARAAAKAEKAARRTKRDEDPDA